jgi:outer membrane protein insertion porin family
VLDVGITERNFRGRGQNLRARVSVGSLRQQIDFGFSEPRFLGRNLVAGLNLYTFRYDLSTTRPTTPSRSAATSASASR